MPALETALLESSDSQIALLNLGCITQSWTRSTWPESRSVVLGYADAAAYQNNPHFMGAIIGRVANRIADAAFSLNGQSYSLNKNETQNTLHGGADGLSTRFWDMDQNGPSEVRFQTVSRHGDQGFPADVVFTVYVRFNANALTYDMNAKVSAPTPIAMTQHNYYNLNGQGTIEGHTLQVPAQNVLQTDEMGLSKSTRPVKGTPQNFNAPRVLKAENHDALDANYCLDGSAINLSNNRDTALSFETSQDGLQVYTAGKLIQENAPYGAQTHGAFSGICLEPQAYPNAVNRRDFPSIIVTPDTPYRHVLTITLSDFAP